MSGQEERDRLKVAFLRLRAALRDPNTGLFAYPYYFDRIRALGGGAGRVGVLWVGIGDRRLIETVYGWEAYERVVRAGAAAVESAPGELLDARTIVASAGVHSDAFLAFVPSEEGRELGVGMLDLLALRLEERVAKALRRGGSDSEEGHARVRVGAALLSERPLQRYERRVHDAVERAKLAAERSVDSEKLSWFSEVQRIVREGDVRCVYQGVVELESRRLVGREAFARGPEGSVLFLPRMLFSLGREAGLGTELDRLCRARALEELPALTGERELLFLNTSAEALSDPEWISHRARDRLASRGLDPSRVVLDIPEGSLSLAPKSYRESVHRLRQAGYRLALDDTGSGTRTSELVEALRPEFVKIDLGHLRGLARDRLKQEVLKSVAELAHRSGSALLAERVEDEEERALLVESGARWGQGNLFGAPGAAKGSPHATKGEGA